MSSAKMIFAPIDSFLGNSTDARLTEYRPCPLCGAMEFEIVYVYNDFQFFSDSNRISKRVLVQTVQCRKCFCVYMNPVYTEYGFSVLFQEAGMSYGSPGGHRALIAGWMENNHLVQDGDKVLDVGCGDGAFLNTLPGYVSKIGVDVDRPSIERGQINYPDIEFVCSHFESFDVRACPDVITMLHVLEHVTDPLATLRRLFSISSPKTRLIIEVPIVEHAIHGDAVGFLSPQHLTHFSKKTLLCMMRKAGWDVLSEFEVSQYNGYRVLAQKSETQYIGLRDVGDRLMLHRFMQSEYSALESLEKTIDNILVHGVDNVVVWGAGQHTEALYHKTTFFSQYRNLRYAIVDSDRAKHSTTWRGIRCYSPEELRNDGVSDVIVISSYGSSALIEKAASRICLDRKSVFLLYNSVQTY